MVSAGLWAVGEVEDVGQIAEPGMALEARTEKEGCLEGCGNRGKLCD
jgi:hypothetical protein